MANATLGTPTATGDLLSTDVDNTADAFQQVAAGATTTNGYGSYGLTAAGVWTYTLDNANATVQALNTSSTPLTDSFTVKSADGTEQVVTVTINGSNDAAVISGTSTGTLLEAGGVANATLGTPTASGNLTVADVDSDEAFQQVGNGNATVNGYGTYGVTVYGVWTYTLDNTNAAVQALNTSSTPLTDSFTVLSWDGTAQVVSVTINGSNDAAVISGTSTASLTETNAVQSTGGSLAATDVDSSNAFVVQTNVGGSNGYGTFSIAAGGAWTYTMGSAHDEFMGGVDYTDSITVATADGTSRVITVTMHGTLDVDAIIGTTVNNTYTFSATISGVHTITDPGSTSGDQILITGNNVGLTSLNFEKTGNDLVIDFNGQHVTVLNHYVSPGAVESITFAAGQTFAGYQLGGTTYNLFAGGTYVAGNGNSNDVIAGTSAPQTIDGGGGSSGGDLLFGNGNNDTLMGRSASDLLVGGAGNDTFVFNTALNATSNVDTIADFTSGADHISLLKSGLFSNLAGSAAATTLGADFSASQTMAGTGAEHVFYDPATGNLYYDANAGSHADAILFANLTNADGITHPTITTTDFIIG